jgi:hypothetical protein
MTTDRWAILGAHALLAITLVAALLGTLASWLRARRGDAEVTVKRSDRSMTGLYVIYGFATVSLTMAIQVSTWGDGHKASLILLDYAILTYLFFFNSWFRNRVVFRLLGRMQRD